VNAPRESGVVVDSKVTQGLRSNRVVHGTEAGHVVRVNYHGPNEAVFSFTALIDPTDSDRNSTTPSEHGAFEPAAITVDVQRGIAATAATPGEASGAQLTSTGATRGDLAGDRSQPVTTLRYVDLPAARRWTGGNEVGPGRPDTRTYQEHVFHDDVAYECRDGREHLIRIDATIAQTWPDAPTTQASVEFVVRCKPA
jgi:hypothetical protein